MFEFRLGDALKCSKHARSQGVLMNTFSGPGNETRVDFLEPRDDMQLLEADASIVP
jgi:hypothetical protein